MFDHLPRPFCPGTVIPSNRDPQGWHWTFRDAMGEEYHYRVIDYRNPAAAKQAMREFCARNGNERIAAQLTTQ